MTRKQVIAGLIVVLVVLAVAEALFAPHHHPIFPWHYWPGFQAAIGLGACVVGVKICKTLGKWVLQRPEENDA